MRRIFFIIILCLLGIAPVAFAATAPLTNPRYISLAPSTTEILFALGLDDEIAGVSAYCDYPPQAKNKVSVGAFSYPNIEKILSLKPDYIFCTGLEQAPVIIELRRLKLKVYVADPKNIKELLNTVRDIGKITERKKQAEDLTKNIESQIEEVSSQVKLIPLNKRPKVFIEIWHDPLTTAGKGSFIDELINLAGAVNIAHNIKRPYSIFSAEEVIKSNPDSVILAYMNKEIPARLMEKRLGWSQISAVKNNRLYNDIDPNILLRPGPRVGEGLKALYNKLYPLR